MTPTTKRGPNTPVNNTNPNNMTPESIQAMIDQALLRNSTNGDGSHSSHGDNRRKVQTARLCYYADFMKYQPLNFKGTEGVVGLTRWIEKIEPVFNISGCAIENQVKFATCTLLGAALTWWNGQIRNLGPEAYAMTWEVKGNDVPAYTERFQEPTLICTKFVANETEKVDKYINGLLDNIYGNVKSARPKTLDETIELANDLMDQKLRTYAERQSDNKRKADDSSRNNHGHQQQPFKRQNVAKVYNMGTGKRKPYGGSLPKCTKCHLHYNGPCTQRCHKCNKVGHFARDCKSTGNANVANTQKGNGAAPKGNGCFECGAPGHFKRDFPNLKNKDRGNGNAQGWVYAVGNAKKRGNAPGNPDANVVMGTFLLNNNYASILFDTDADRSFISTTFSSLINIAPTPLENFYDVELADGRLVGIDTIIRGCTLNFLDHPFNIDLMPVELGSFDVIIDEREHEEHLKVILELLKKRSLHLRKKITPKTCDNIGELRRKFKFEWGEKKRTAYPVEKSKAVKCPKYGFNLKEAKTFSGIAVMRHTKCLGAVLMHERRYETLSIRNPEMHRITAHKSLQHILDQNELNISTRRWLDLLRDVSTDIRDDIRYQHQGKAQQNRVADALSRKNDMRAMRFERLSL
ncbi:putative reverse transcriptase domain-containing protein [Tanacetum coccineum]